MAATVWRGRITFGLVSVPVRLYKAARRERIRFHRVHRAPPVAEELEEEQEAAPPPQYPRQLSSARAPLPAPEETEISEEPEAVVRVHSAPVSGFTEEPVQQREVLRGYEVAKDQYVVVEPHEVAALRPKTSTALEIVEFVHLNEIDPVYFDTSYYVVPEPGGEKPYAVLFRALKEAGYVGLGTLAMHGREHATVVRPGPHGLLLHTLFYANEIGAANEYHADPDLVGAKELELAKLLVGTLEAKFDPAKLKDTFEERLRELIESRPTAALAGRAPAAEAKKSPVIDIMEALRQSLEKMRKPAKSEERAQPRRRKAK